ncbi:hypothetical protein WISP_00184 [Willisornis vidua]|uniref:WD repeat-containing protein 54 beta-propeller domain-containing protein n=1 Tax=Willisornis vidua TaxID=1566151 RepID=A0ABQ9CJM9_9PASS|nr:hypothetical protein WISP_00184 [Willisornis vidua]
MAPRGERDRTRRCPRAAAAPAPPAQIQHCHAECVTDTQVCGARFCDPAGDTFAVTGYDLSEILCYGPA